jgi:hypothetical protein
MKPDGTAQPAAGKPRGETQDCLIRSKIAP